MEDRPIIIGTLVGGVVVREETIVFMGIVETTSSGTRPGSETIVCL